MTYSPLSVATRRSSSMAFDTATVSAIVVEPRSESRVLDRTLLRGITWTGGIKLVTVVPAWTSTIIVAHILRPTEYGIVTMATVFIGFATMVTDFGLGGAIVALRELSGEVAAQLHAVAAVVGFGACAVSCIVAVPLSRFFATPALVPVVISLSSILMLDSLRIVRTSILARQLRFKYLSLLEALKAVSAVVFTITLAFLGAAYWALVLGNI